MVRYDAAGTPRFIPVANARLSPRAALLGTTRLVDLDPNGNVLRLDLDGRRLDASPIAVGTLTSRALGSDGTVAAFAYANASGLLSVVRLKALGDVLDVDPWRIPGDTANAFRPTSITGGGGRWTVAASNAVAQFDASGTFLRRVALPDPGGVERPRVRAPDGARDADPHGDRAAHAVGLSRSRRRARSRGRSRSVRSTGRRRSRSSRRRCFATAPWP